MKKVATMNISERQIRNIVRESIRRSLKNRLNEWRWDDPVEHDRQKAIWARFGYEMIDREDDEPIFVDKDGNEFVLDDYGHHLVPVENNFDDESEEEFLQESVQNYETYVLVNDSDGSVIGNYTEGNGYDAKAEAIMDAKERAGHDRFGSYTVYGCTEGGYDDTTIVFSTAGEDVHLFNLEESVVKRCVAKVLKEYDHHDPDSDWESEVERADAMRDQEKDRYVDSLDEDSKYTEQTNYNVDVSDTLRYVNKAFDTLDRMMKRMFERSDLFGENLGSMAFETARKLREMKESLNKEFTNSQTPNVNRTLRPRRM